MNSMIHYSIKVTGKVQGVWFRRYTQKKAQELELSGFVKNMPDSSVYIEVEGEQSRLDNFIKWLHTGSPLSNVKTVRTEQNEVIGFTGFEIRR